MTTSITSFLRLSCLPTVAVALALGAATSPVPALAAPGWTASWQASPQPVWGQDFLFPLNLPRTLRDQTVRQVARLSLGGPRLRIVLSNQYGTAPVTVGRTTLALPSASAPDVAGAVLASSLRPVTFGGREQATIAAGASLISDPVVLPVPALAQVVVSLYLPAVTPMTTFHWDGRQTGWIVAGDQAAATTLDTANVLPTTARALLSAIAVETDPAAPTVAVLGDSITDGATASLDTDHRWPDFLAARLAPHGVAVVNAGISGARLLSDGMGVNALARWERDVLAQPGVRTAIVMLGINDIAWPGTAFARQAQRPTVQQLVAGYRQLVAQAHARGVRVIGATLTPFEGALPGTPLADYYSIEKDALRAQLNERIRAGGIFDAVIDFDAVLRDPAHPSRMAPRYDSGDHLHAGDEGHRAMAGSVDLSILLPAAGDRHGAMPGLDSMHR
ncbi:SGNH/GDSL hydrolase family protein [Herbaspirillum sp. YR522]|uniref:SGNH/GDSL hydrolase family protein n=1 Tax=Herbaspirillum sp. YR522 TaxID=1144342 RepID=UPI00068455F6|nr:SGNH/GDSL hydrolase family protein [Herbaspirillum sp. YR522]